MGSFLIADNVPAFFDIWVVGDHFLDSVVNKWQELQNTSWLDRKNKNKDRPTLYMADYYNVRPFCYTQTATVKPAIARIVNSLIDGVNQEHRLPKYLIVVIDWDIIDDLEFFDFGADKCLAVNINWLFKHIDITLRRARLQLTECRPRAVQQDNTKVIFVTMIKRIKHYPVNSKIAYVCTMRAKFNELLNKVAARFDNNFILLLCSSRSFLIYAAICQQKERWHSGGKLTSSSKCLTMAKLNSYQDLRTTNAKLTRHTAMAETLTLKQKVTFMTEVMNEDLSMSIMATSTDIMTTFIRAHMIGVLDGKTITAIDLYHMSRGAACQL